jgi:hypothetical protein
MQTKGELHRGPVEILFSMTYKFAILKHVQRISGSSTKMAAIEEERGQRQDQFCAVEAFAVVKPVLVFNCIN